MVSRARTFGALVILLWPGSAALAADLVCSHDVFAVDGSPVTATICAPAAGGATRGGTLDVSASFATKSATINKTVTLSVLPGEAESRAIEEVPLAPLGLSRSLYLTIVYRAGRVGVTHAVLLPGALTLK